MSLSSLEAQAKAEIAKIENEAVAEYIKLKMGQFSWTTLLITSGAALVVGVILRSVL